jgi:hypothetical protein
VDNVELADRAYGPESSLDERNAIADRVSVINDRLLLLREVPVQSAFSVNLMFDRMETLAHDWERFAYVVDLTEAKRPDPETRVALKQRVLGLSSRISHVAIVVGNNRIMRAMARLFAHGMGLVSVSVHATCAEAIEEAGVEMGR